MYGLWGDKEIIARRDLGSTEKPGVELAWSPRCHKVLPIQLLLNKSPPTHYASWVCIFIRRGSTAAPRGGSGSDAKNAGCLKRHLLLRTTRVPPLPFRSALLIYCATLTWETGGNSLRNDVGRVCCRLYFILLSLVCTHAH